MERNTLQSDLRTRADPIQVNFNIGQLLWSICMLLRKHIQNLLITSRVMSSPGKQVRLDGFVKSEGSLPRKEATMASSSQANGSKRPRPDGTDVPPESKKPKASGTYRAFPANPPEPNEVNHGNATILDKLEQTLKKAKAISASVIASSRIV